MASFPPKPNVAIAQGLGPLLLRPLFDICLEELLTASACRVRDDSDTDRLIDGGTKPCVGWKRTG